MNQEQDTTKPKRGRPRLTSDTSKEVLFVSQITFDTLKETGIPLKWVIFQNTIRSWNDTPHSQLFNEDPTEGAKKEKQAKIWATPHFLLFEARGIRDMIPMSNVRDMRVL